MACGQARPTRAPPRDDAAIAPHGWRNRRAGPTGATTAKDECGRALRRLRLDGPLQPVPAPVSLCAPERVCSCGDVRVQHEAEPRDLKPERRELPERARARFAGRPGMV